MKFFLLASVVASALAIAPPRIELSLDGEPYKLNYGITREHHSNSNLASHQDYTLKCAASRDQSAVSMRSTGTADCKFPRATAYDHYEKDISSRIEYQMWVGGGAQKQKHTCSTVDDCKIDFSVRETYLFMYDVSDSHNNHADQIVFALVVDDMVPPVISSNGCDGRKIEAGTKPNGFSVCSGLYTKPTAEDNIDQSVPLKYDVRYKSFDESSTWSSLLDDATDLANVNNAIDTTIQGQYELVISAEDSAGIYGYEGQNNYATHTTIFLVNDTLPPTIHIHGFDPDYHECGATYGDGGATATDILDTEALNRTIDVSVQGDDFNVSVIGGNSLQYTASDQKGNEAQAKTRQVIVVDTTPPVILLKGLPKVIHYANETTIEDEGVEVSDNCGPYELTTRWHGTPFSNTALGEYTRIYTAKDTSNNTAEVSRIFVNVDVTKPVIQLEGLPTLHLNSSATEVYEDAGATCRDWVDHELSHAVEVSGDVVDLSQGGEYTIVYNCQDLSGNRAVPVERKVIVADTSCPVITLKGARVNFIEPNFPYVDAGATASDDLDGDISDRIVTDGDTVNVAEAFFTRRNCQEIKQKANSASADHVASGEYMVTRYVRNNVKQRVLVWCDMTAQPTAKTYYAVVDGQRVTPYGADRGSCADVGMWMVQNPQNTMHDFAKTKFETDFAGKVFFSTHSDHLGADGKTDAYICDAHQDPAVGDQDTATDGAHITFTEDRMTKINWHNGAEAGKYIIEYRVQDYSNNTQCDVKYRTVLVRSDIPDVPSSLQINAMAENANTQRGWFIGAIVSAVTGLSLLALTSSRKQQSLAVPV